MKNETNRIMLTLALGWVCMFLAACGDTISEPEILADQQALSDLAKNRNAGVAVYYEGESEYEGRPVRVFAEVFISKFTPGRTINLYYLPADSLLLESGPGTYAGADALRLDHRLRYVHDRGTFELYSGKYVRGNNRLETVQAGFTEQYTLAEERCMEAGQVVGERPLDAARIEYAANICFFAGMFEESKTFTHFLADRLERFPRPDQASAQHKYHTFMGRHRLREGDVEGARVHLRQSIEGSKSPSMQSFGPNMSLARDLLNAGERDAVLGYLDACADFWKDGQLAQWKDDIGAGRVPDFGANLNY